MIVGLQLDFTSKELKDHIQTRSNHHKERAEWYEKQVKSLKDGGLERHDATLDPVSSLERQMTTHREKHVLFEVFASHVVPEETYRLTERDLMYLEFVSQYF